MKRYNKKGQFFILAAVIISAVVISLGVTTNEGVVNNDPETFEDFTYEVKKETGAVIDHEIYSNFDSGDNLTEFIELLAEDIRDRDSQANFMFVYGNEEGLVFRNYGADSAYVGDDEVEGEGQTISSTICIGGSCDNQETGLGESGSREVRLEGYELDEVIEERNGRREVGINAWGVDFGIPVTENVQVIFLIQKETEDENYVSVR